MKGDGFELVWNTIKFTPKERGEGLTAYQIAESCGLTARHVNRILQRGYQEGAFAYRELPYRNTFKREWCFTLRAKKMNRDSILYPPEWTINPSVIRQLELPL